MSLSSFPDIFKLSTSLDTKLKKQGGIFSLHLQNHSQQSINAKKVSTAYKTKRSSSLNNVHTTAAPSSILHHKIKSTQSPSKLDIQYFSNQLPYESSLQKIYQSNGKGSANYRRSGVGFTSQFAIQTNRKLNNKTIDMDEADNLSNIMEKSLKQAEKLTQTINQDREDIEDVKQGLQSIKNNTEFQLQSINTEFMKSFKDLYNTLSRLRRITNSELKINKIQATKVYEELKVASQFYNTIHETTQNLKQSCLFVEGTSQLQEKTFYMREKTGSRTAHKSREVPFQEQISSIRKSSRGGIFTGQMNRKRNSQFVLEQLQRVKQDQDLLKYLNNDPTQLKDKKFYLNGKCIDLLNQQEHDQIRFQM